jgi:UDP-N-acetylglucosamine 2-epimerase (non-hydrolysing)
MIGMIAKSEFVVSDGGGLQEETYFVDKPMFILRSKTERLFGLDETAFLSFFDKKRFDYFFANYKKFKRKAKLDGVSPSKIIVDEIVSILGQNCN